MCVIAYKPQGVAFPKSEVLKTCFANNPDGAGFMVACNGQVHIEKGFMDYDSFEFALNEYRRVCGDNCAYVMHFRISTQGGVNKECTHPFPLSRDMSELRKLQVSADIGIAHNGIISLTSKGYNKKIDYSDTMEFITKYLSLIIHDKLWATDDNIELITRLCGSKLAILNSDGTCELLGDGWVKDGDMWYSNTSYIPYKYIYKPKSRSYKPSWYYTLPSAEIEDCFIDADDLYEEMYHEDISRNYESFSR